MPDDSDPTQIYEQYQQLLFGEENKASGKEHWDFVIIRERKKIQEEKERRKLNLSSDGFLNR